MQSQDLKVVAHRSDGVLIKGYTDGVPQFYAASLANPDPVAPPEKLRLKTTDNSDIEVSLDDLKALFFVKSFEGSNQSPKLSSSSSTRLWKGSWCGWRFKTTS